MANKGEVSYLDVCREVSYRVNLPIKDVLLVYRAMAQTVAGTIRASPNGEVRIPYVGRFRSKPGRIKYVTEKKMARDVVSQEGGT